MAIDRPGSSVGIATDYGLDGPGIESRWGARFSTGPGLHPACYTMGTGSFPGVKCGQGVKLTPNPLVVPWSWKGTAIPQLPLWAVRPVQSLSTCTRLTFTFTLFMNGSKLCCSALTEHRKILHQTSVETGTKKKHKSQALPLQTACSLEISPLVSTVAICDMKLRRTGR